MGRIPFYLFALAALLIGVAYYAGLVTDVNALGTQGNRLAQTITGRNPQGTFASYPGGG